jgi:hypothetical protein
LHLAQKYPSSLKCVVFKRTSDGEEEDRAPDLRIAKALFYLAV